MYTSTRPVHGAQRGQAMLETVMVLPLLLALVVGLFAAGQVLTTTQLVITTVNGGARLASELGNDGYSAGQAAHGCQASSVDPCAVDARVLAQVLTQIHQDPAVRVIEVDIYQPRPCPGPGPWTYSGSCPATSGTLQPGEPEDRYDGGGMLLAGTVASYTLDLRNQVHPTEASVAVRVQYTYRSTVSPVSLTLAQYASMRLVPNEGAV